jgi:hypothetical protein
MITPDGKVINSDTGKTLKPSLSNIGYSKIGLMIGGKKKTMYVHRLVAEVYLGASELTVDHINEIKTDNRLSNLQYLTRAENSHKTRRQKDLPMYVSRYMKKKQSKWMYRYIRRIENKNIFLYSSIDLDKVLRFKLNYERLWNF